MNKNQLETFLSLIEGLKPQSSNHEKDVRSRPRPKNRGKPAHANTAHSTKLL